MKYIYGLLAILGFGGCIKPLTLHIVLPYKPHNFKPNVRSDFSTVNIVSNFYEPLVKYDADLRIKPSLARYWEHPDSLTWIFYLVKGKKFYSKKQFWAEDVVWTFKKIWKDSISDYYPDISLIDTLIVLDSFRILIKLRAPVVDFLARLTQILIIEKGCTENDLKFLKCGTGVLRPVEFSGTSIKAVFKDPSISPFKEVIFSWKSDINPDTFPDRNYFIFLDASDRSKSKTLVRVQGPLNILRYIGVNLWKYPGKNRDFRKAIYLAIDRLSLADSLKTYVKRLIVPAYEFALPTQIDYLPVDMLLSEFKKKEVSHLLKLSGYSYKDTLILAVSKRRFVYGRLIADQLKAKGLKVRVIKVAPSRIFTYKRDPGNVDLFILAFAPQSLTMFSAMKSILETFRLPRTKEIDEMKKIISQIPVSRTTYEERSYLREIQRLFLKYLPLIPLFYEGSTFYISPDLKWKPPMDEIIKVEEVKLRK